MIKLPKDVKLIDGRIATISFLKDTDSAKEQLKFINALIDEEAKLIFNKKKDLRQEKAWLKSQLEAWKKGTGYEIVAHIGGKIAGTSTAGQGIERTNSTISLGIAIAKEYRGIGLGEAMLRTNIDIAREFFKPEPRIIFLTVFSNNVPALGLYHKLGFKEFMVFPKCIEYQGRYIDHIYMKLEG